MVKKKEVTEEKKKDDIELKRYAELFKNAIAHLQKTYDMHVPTKGHSWMTSAPDFLRCKMIEEFDEWFHDLDTERENGEITDIINVAMMLLERLLTMTDEEKQKAEEMNDEAKEILKKRTSNIVR